MTCRLCRQGFGLHLTTCRLAPAKPERPQRQRTAPSGYSRPSRPRVPRADYLASVAAPHGTARCAARGCKRPECVEARRAKQRAYKARKKALAQTAVAG